MDENAILLKLEKYIDIFLLIIKMRIDKKYLIT